MFVSQLQGILSPPTSPIFKQQQQQHPNAYNYTSSHTPTTPTSPFNNYPLAMSWRLGGKSELSMLTRHACPMLTDGVDDH